MNKNRVLLIGTSYSAIPLLEYLKQKGYYVYVCGNIENDPCCHYADGYFRIDYSDENQLLEICKNNDFDFIIPTCNDYSYNSASYVSKVLNKFYGFDDFEITKILHIKANFREFAIKSGISAPNAIKYHENIDFDNLNLKFPLLVKPAQSFSGRGVTKILDKTELRNTIEFAKKHSRNKEVVIEEFIEGSLHSHSAFIQDGKILIDFFVDEFCTVYPYQVNSSCLSYNLDDKIKDLVRKEIEKIVSLLNLVDGLVHTQFITNGDKIWLIEIMRRCPGDLYGTLIQKSTGFNYAEFYCKPFLGEKSSVNNINLKQNFVARHTISSDKNLIFRAINFNTFLKNFEFYPLKESGHILNKAPFDKVGIVFCEFETKEDLIKNVAYMDKFVNINKVEGVFFNGK